MILSQKILKQLIVEAMSRMEAECAADVALAQNLPVDTVQALQRLAGQTVEDEPYPRENVVLALMHPGHRDTFQDKIDHYKRKAASAHKHDKPHYEERAQALENCLKVRQQLDRDEEREKGEAKERWDKRTRKPFKRAPRPRSDDGSRPPADTTFVIGDVRESLIRQMIMEELKKNEACCIALRSFELSSVIKSKMAQFSSDPDGGKARKAALTCDLADIIARKWKSWEAYDNAWKRSLAPNSETGQSRRYLTYEKIVDCVKGIIDDRDRTELDACNSCDVADYEKYEKEEEEWNAPGSAETEAMQEMIMEELTKIDKDEIKKMISTEMEKSLKSELKKILQDELLKELGSKKTKEEIGEITKKIIKKLYKDLSFHHPYIIDRIKV